MFCTFVFVTLAMLVGNDLASAQQIPSTTTAAELWNPWTWFWPYAIASAEGYRDYFQKAQKATNELYQQIYKTNAFPWITGDWSSSQNASGNSTQPSQGGNTQQDNQSNSTQTNQGNSTQPNQGNSTQTNQDQTNQNTGENAPQGGQNDQAAPENGNAQVQGNVQTDGTANAEVNSK